MARAVFVERCPMISHWWQVFVLVWGLLAFASGVKGLIDGVILQIDWPLVGIAIIAMGMGAIAIWRTLVRRREIHVGENQGHLRIGWGPPRRLAWNQVRRVTLAKGHEMASPYTWPLSWWTARATFWTVADARFELDTGQGLRFRSREPAKLRAALEGVLPASVERAGKGWTVEDWQ